MTSSTKSEPDFDESDEEPSLPRDADSTDYLHEVDDESDHTSSTDNPIAEPDDSRQQPTSPGTARKRGFEEVFQKSHIPILSTTPQKTPPKNLAFPYRSTAESHNIANPFGQALERPGASALRNVMTAESPPPSTVATVIEPDTRDKPVEEVVSGRKNFVQEIQSFQESLEDDFRQFEEYHKGRDRSAELAALDWDDLERRFIADLDPLIAQEERIRQKLSQRLQQFLLWMQISSEKEGERAIKRLRTRRAFVEHSESKLDEKQDHYRKVVEAFETAMRLLSVS